MNRIAESIVSACFDLDECQHISISSDEIDLAEPAPVALGQDPASSRLQVACGKFLRRTPECLSPSSSG